MVRLRMATTRSDAGPARVKDEEGSGMSWPGRMFFVLKPKHSGSFDTILAILLKAAVEPARDTAAVWLRHRPLACAINVAQILHTGYRRRSRKTPMQGDRFMSNSHLHCLRRSRCRRSYGIRANSSDDTLSADLAGDVAKADGRRRPRHGHRLPRGLGRQVHVQQRSGHRRGQCRVQLGPCVWRHRRRSQLRADQRAAGDRVCLHDVERFKRQRRWQVPAESRLHRQSQRAPQPQGDGHRHARQNERPHGQRRER